MRTRLQSILLLALLLAPIGATAEESLLMGVFPRRNATQTSQFFSPLADYLSKQLGRQVKLVITKDFPTFWKDVKAKRYDIVHYNQYHYIESADDYDVIVCNQEQGSDEIAGALYVRKDSGITEIGQLRGRNIIFGGGKDAMMSYIVPRHLLLKGGLGENDFITHFASNPPNAVLAAYFKQADAAGAGDVVMKLPTVTHIAKVDDLRYLAVSKPIKQLPWAVRRDHPAKLRDRIQALMTGLGTSDEGKAILKAAHVNGFSQVVDGDYDSAREIITDVMPGSRE